MTSRLVPCSSCSRHVRLDSQLCPFCSTPNTAVPELAPLPASGRLGSLALMTFRAATLGVAISACSGESGPSGQGGAGGVGGAAAAGGNLATGGVPDTADGGTSGSSNGSGGTIELGSGGNVDGFGGSGVPIYRATPRG